MDTYNNLFANMGAKAKKAAQILQVLPGQRKNEVLLAIAKALEERSQELLEANCLDLQAAEDANMSISLLDRLRLSEERIQHMAEGIRQVSQLEEPIGNVLDVIYRPNGLKIEKRSVPLGVVAIIYEARPNVTLDAAVLCLKSGNATILRGGKEAFYSNQMIVSIIQDVLCSSGIPKEAVQLVEILDREAVPVLLKQRQWIDVVIPRGGAGLIKRVVEESSVPVIETGSGVCHIYVDASADINKVIPIILNAKVQRPSVCNAIETVLVHKDVAPGMVEAICEALHQNAVLIYGDKGVKQQYLTVLPVDNSSWATEYGDLSINIGIVNSIDQAIDHIRKYSTKHSECIITEDTSQAQLFMNAIDAAVVYVNASTRFSDGFEFGFGAEIGISTQKLHARGPMGLLALTTYKYYVYGDGQIRK